MPTESKKKKSKKDEKKEEKKMSSLLVKSEPTELKSLEHYVDDRVELIRQIFDSLKSKTIESIIPDFLQVKSIKNFEAKSIAITNSYEHRKYCRQNQWKRFKSYALKKCWVFQRNDYIRLFTQQNVPQIRSHLIQDLMLKKLKVRLSN